MQLLPEIAMEKAQLPFASFQRKALEVQESKGVLAVAPILTSAGPSIQSPFLEHVGIAALSCCYSQRLQSNEDHSPVQTITSNVFMLLKPHPSAETPMEQGAELLWSQEDHALVTFPPQLRNSLFHPTYGPGFLLPAHRGEVPVGFPIRGC